MGGIQFLVLAPYVDKLVVSNPDDMREDSPEHHVSFSDMSITLCKKNTTA